MRSNDAKPSEYGPAGFPMRLTGTGVMRLCRRVLLASALAAAAFTAAEAGNENGIGGGGDGGGTGATPPPTTTQCYMSSGAGANFNLSQTQTTFTASLNFTLPPGNFAMRQRLATQGLDGAETSDTGWQDLSDGGAITVAGGGTASMGIGDNGNSLDYGGGVQFELQFTNTQTGEVIEADGYSYPPDAVTGSC